MTLALAPATGLERRIARRLHDRDAYHVVSVALTDVALRAIHPASVDGSAGPTAMGVLEDPVAGATRAAIETLIDELSDLVEELPASVVERLIAEQRSADLGLE
jgi:hypothetical protein